MKGGVMDLFCEKCGRTPQDSTGHCKCCGRPMSSTEQLAEDLGISEHFIPIGVNAVCPATPKSLLELWEK